MLGSRLTLAALCAVVLPTAFAGIENTVASSPLPHVTLQAIVAVGSTTACGMREAPHLIEHLLLSGTTYGENPVDAVIALRAKGIKLSALTRSDFTQFTLEGPADKAKVMEQAIATFLGQSSLPKAGFEREKHAIIHELRAPDSYVSSPTFYERFIAATAGAVEPCKADQDEFLSYDYEDVQSGYSRLYNTRTIRLVAQAPAHTFDLASITAAVMKGRDASPPISQSQDRESVRSIDVVGSEEQVEIIFPIAGRASLPEDAANAFADQARLELQAFIRQKYQLYSARSFVDQSIQGGWIRLEVPGLDHTHAPELLEVATSAIARIDSLDFGSDPIWQAYGAQRVDSPVGAPIVAKVDPQGASWAARLSRTLDALKNQF